ncbi:hypothetical protein BEN47_16720 [Hymenobacter lapidarius]|uniref:Uncharacterized protein n=1 Tax=Hymenobacter lapidarius TaxID=1908237 RepID=A0A1G1SZR3_9BACT|nr:hypothetical protein [Hymenobacter lapidarius]OGX84120.1 hypothetical protein BEN47_16720 [Hymenobacter lapidarius]
MPNISFHNTWADLLAGLQTLTPEQLARPIEASTENNIFHDVSLEITTCAQFFSDGEWQGEDADLQEEEKEGMIRIEAGEVYLALD